MTAFLCCRTWRKSVAGSGWLQVRPPQRLQGLDGFGWNSVPWLVGSLSLGT